jgi:hypothetical protein
MLAYPSQKRQTVFNKGEGIMAEQRENPLLVALESAEEKKEKRNSEIGGLASAFVGKGKTGILEAIANERDYSNVSFWSYRRTLDMDEAALSLAGSFFTSLGIEAQVHGAGWSDFDTVQYHNVLKLRWTEITSQMREFLEQDNSSHELSQ